MKKIKYIDLFAGIGGFHYGIDRAVEANEKRVREENSQEIRAGKNKSETNGHTRMGDISSKSQQHIEQCPNRQFTCVYSNEWDKYSNSVYRRHYGECDNRDITTVKASEIPDHDLLVGGFPCQSFSIAGKRGGFDDTRGTLFFDIARILKEKQPRLCLLENVKGLLSHDNGRTIKIILSTLVELGYDVQWQVLNSKNHGVPQNRERIFIIGHLRGTSRPQVFHIGESNGGDITSKQDDSRTARTVSARFRKGVGNTESRIIDVLVDSEEGKRIRNIEELAQKLSRLGTQQIKRLAHSNKFRRYNQTYDTSGIVEALDVSGGGGHQPCIPSGASIRRLTPVECERLQGFPDNWTQYGANGELISDTQRYKMCGNAVTTNVITDIVKRLI